jgi:gluconokinase
VAASGIGRAGGFLAVSGAFALEQPEAARYLTRMHVPGLRSCYEKVGGIYYLGRLFDKIRLHAAGKLPQEYQANLGKHFDARALTFLHVDYPSVVEQVKQGGTDDQVLDWCFQHGRRPTDEEIEVWNGFMRKRGWNDEGTPTLLKRLQEIHSEDRTDIQTSFDFIDLDEGRDPRENPRQY